MKQLMKDMHRKREREREKNITKELLDEQGQTNKNITHCTRG
jgi:hypothetical protein